MSSLNYNPKYVCSYNNSDVFLESEEQILNEDEKGFVRDALYRRDLCNIFKIDDQCFDEQKFRNNIIELFKNIDGKEFLKLCIPKDEKYFYNLELSFIILFSFDYLYLVQPCISEFFETGKISDSNESFIELKKLLF